MYIEKACYYIIYRVLKLDLAESKFLTFTEFIKFGIVGLSNTLISYCMYLITLYLCNRTKAFIKYDYLIATVISFILSVLWSFYWNKKFVFKLSGGWKATVVALLKTYMSYSFTGLFLSSTLAVLWVEVLGITKIISPVLNLIVSVPVNFLLNKYWAFKGK